MLRLESLANELLLDLFEFLGNAHLVQAFFGLNSRFNELLYYHCRVHELCFQSIAKEYFDIICQECSPAIIDQTSSLRLSNEKTSNFTESLPSRGFTLDQFTHLKSLSLYHINSLDKINQIIIRCHRLSHLNRLNVINCYTNNPTINIVNINNDIWKLPKLTHYTIKDNVVKDAWLSKISVISRSIECLSINHIDGYSNILQHLFEITPRLQQLDINICYWLGRGKSGSVVSSITSMKTSFKGDVYSMINLFKKMPNLCSLTLETWDIYLNGNDWEQIFMVYLPKIKIFRLKMNFDFSSNENIKNRIDQLIDTFRTYFWLEERQWYVRCNYYYLNGFKTAMLYTSSYNFNELPSINPHYSKSTDPHNEDFFLYDRLEVSRNMDITQDLFVSSNLSNTSVRNSHHLEVTLPLIDDCDRYYSSFDQLTSLHVTLSNVLDYRQLQIMLDEAYHLYSLKFYSFGGSPIGLFQLTSSSIRQLDLLIAQDQYGKSFSHTDCLHLINSSLGYQCEILLIKIENRATVIDLIKGMPNLQVLTFRCVDLISIYEKYPKMHQKFVPWLQKNLPSTCSVTIDLEDKSLIYIRTNRHTVKTHTCHDASLKPRHKRISHILSSIRHIFFQKD